MPGSPRRRVASALGLLAGAQAALLLAAPRALGAVPAQDDGGACDSLIGPARDYCEKEDDGGRSAPNSPGDVTESVDPLSSLAKGCAEAAAWTIDKLSDAVTSTTTVDFTNTTFLRQYAVVFAASTILTLTLWLLAVAKRAIRGVPLTEALGEALGFLWLTVLASAFTPLVLYTLVTATDSVTEAIASGTSSNTDTFFGGFSEALKKGEDIGGGPIMLIVVSLVSVLAAGVLWLELVIRAALLYVGALLGTAVYAGLVDKNMWHHVRRWAGIMIAVILVKPVIVIVLGLAGALSAEEGPDAFSAVVSGLAIILLAIFASAMIYRFVPGFGDEIMTAKQGRRATSANPASAVMATPAALVTAGMKTHGSRSSSSGPAGGTSGESRSAAKPANPVAGGVSAHSTRPQQSTPSKPRTANHSSGAPGPGSGAQGGRGASSQSAQQPGNRR
ncbi:hypothetical protein O7599_17720 [Streptomyces sp. WMMC500]|uniref:hypothetical protein n=1 Tax=Streptomyces sp. WMMC500 TaxID=3015154 RepID=UPI00248AE09E|nr:hypothetical protein [Streptomyces sp. WMMC500]WBB64233.1 hypothetical protein O7599_17720 [Streptomyces sp. WMMC500]